MTEYFRGSSKYIDFSAAGELWNRVPDEIYVRKTSTQTEFFYTFLDIMEPQSESILATEETDLIDILSAE